MTGYDLLNWLHKQSPNDLNKPVGVTGHFGEFYPMTEFPEIRSAKSKYDGRYDLMVLAFEKIDIGPEPE